MKIILSYILFFLPLIGSTQLFSPIYPNSVKKNSMVLEYDFSNSNSFNGTGTTVNNLYGTTPSGTIANTPLLYQDPGYIKFNGSNQFFTFGDLASYSAPTSSSTRSGVFTVSFWMNPKANNGVVLADLGTSTINSNYHTVDIEMVNGMLKFSVWPKDTTITTSTALALNSWYFVSLVYDGAYIAAYLNGNLIKSAPQIRQGPQMGSLTTSQYFSFAANDITNMGSGAYGNFLLSDIKYYSTPLSAKEIYQNYLDEESRYDLIFYVDGNSNQLSYPGSGTTWNDISGAGKTATNNTGATYNAAAGGSIYYNGGGTGYSDFSFNLNNSSTITIEMWAYPTSFNGGMFFGFNLFDVWTAGGAMGYNSGNGDQFGLSSSLVTSLGLLNNWKHYVFVMNSGSYLSNKIYVNTINQSLTQVAASQITSAVNFNNGSGRIACWLANTSYTQPMYLASFKIYNRELTQAEINSKFNKTKSRYGL